MRILSVEVKLGHSHCREALKEEGSAELPSGDLVLEIVSALGDADLLKRLSEIGSLHVPKRHLGA